MPTNLVLCVKNAVDAATMSASPTMLSTMPPSNVQIPARGRVARSSGTAAQQINFTWAGQGYYLNFLTLMRHNLESGATWRVQLFSDLAWTTQIYDSGTVAAYDYATLGDLDFGVDPLGSGVFDSFLGQKFSVVYFTRVLALSGRVTITDVGNSAGYVEASRLFAGDYAELLFNPSSASMAWEDNTEQSRAAGGSLRSDAGVAYRKMGFAVDFLDASQRAQFADMYRYAGKRQDVFVSLYPGAGGEKERDYTMLAKFAGAMPDLVVTADKFGLLRTQLNLEET